MAPLLSLYGVSRLKHTQKVPSGPMSDDRVYSEDEAHEILKLANEASVPGSTISRSELMRSAAEAGIPPEAILRAEEALSQQRSESTLWAEFQQSMHRRAWSGVSSWLGTSILLLGINFLTGFHSFWSAWPIGIWGLVVISEALQTAIRRPWNDRAKFERWKTKRARKGEESPSID